MAWWGSVLGGVLGLMALGPIGGILGAVLGSKLTKASAASGMIGGFSSSQERKQTSFFVATFTVMGHIAKADGHVSQQEIDYVKSVMAHMHLQPDQRETAIKLFNEGKKPDFPIEDVIRQFYDECKRSKNVLRTFLAIQIQAAQADGRVSAEENATLHMIAEHLRFNQHEFAGMFEHERVSGRDRRLSLEDDYKILEIESDVSDDEVRRAYRRMMSRYHPDKLVSKGLPDEMIDFATERTKEIRAAYERIRDARKARTTH